MNMLPNLEDLLMERKD